MKTIKFGFNDKENKFWKVYLNGYPSFTFLSEILKCIDEQYRK